MENLKFVQLQKENEEHYQLLESLMIPYHMELNAHKPDPMITEEFLRKFTRSSIDMQGDSDRHLELCYSGDNLIGFLYGKVDHEDHRGHKKPGFGYIMEFYVKPEYRRKGYGKAMFKRLESLFAIDGAKRLYLNTGTDAGIAFWTGLGFFATDEIQPHNNMAIYEKEIDKFNAIPMQPEHIEFVYKITFCDYNKVALHSGETTLDEWKKACVQNLADPDEANFIIRRGALPVAWLKINGLQGKNIAWISMLVVHESFQHQGIGSFAVHFTEEFAKSKGKTGVGIHTNVDNVAAGNLYKKLGYTITKESECTNGDGKKRRGLTFFRDHFDAVEMCIDGVSFHVGELHDFSFISKIGKVFRVFDAMDSGNICFGVGNEGKRYFIKYAGARTQDYKGDISDAVNRLKSAVKVYEDLQHPYLIRLIEHYPTGNGYVAIFDWVNGEGLRSYWDYAGQAMWNHPQSPNYRFRHLPINKRIGAVDKIFAFNQHVTQYGYVPIDFYDGSLLYDFETDEIHICDIDFYRKMPATNDMGKMWGSDRFMSPEEYEFSAPLDEVKTVYNMGAAAFELLCIPTKDSYDIDHSFESWSSTKALFNVAAKAVSHERSERYKTIAELIMAWNTAKTVSNIVYKKLSPDDINENMLNSYNRYEEVTYDYTPQDGKYILEHKPYIVNWSIDRKHEVINKYLSSNVYSGVCVWGAYDDNKIVGFSAISNNRFGSKKQYIRLLLMHTAYEYRGKGIGKILFEKAISSARELQAEKLYITASSSLGTQNFYKAMGCIYAEEIVPELFEEEPKDIHMEYTLEN